MRKYWLIGIAVLAVLVGVVSFAAAQADVETAVAQPNPAPVLQDGDVEPEPVDAGVDTNVEITVPEEAVPIYGPNFVDEDGDGVCDVCGGVPQGDMYGNGRRFGAAGQHPNFVDEDGDGVCDICGNEPYAGPNGAAGANFVDEDGDGVCDNVPLMPRDGTGNQYGRMGHGGPRFGTASQP
ncbi:MAG: hypothetical protein D6835_06935 [Candidatus Thermofonsia bacterium]|nr:MAG: hypothetical protein D6835_06935 [Candidatus Thermofonsia bacterium]